MSIFHRSAYLTLSTLLAIAPAACGGDDDDGNNPDASNGGADAAPSADSAPAADAAEADAAPIEGDQFLLGLGVEAVTSLGTLTGVQRAVATINVTGATADIALQALYAPECNADMSGLPLGDSITSTGVAIGEGGTFTLELTEITLPAGSFGSDNALSCSADVVATLTIAGTVQSDGAPCGTLDGTSEMPLPGTTITGTFGGVPIETGTVGDDNLPDALTDCTPPALR